MWLTAAAVEEPELVEPELVEDELVEDGAWGAGLCVSSCMHVSAKYNQVHITQMMVDWCH